MRDCALQSGGGGIRTHEPPCDGQRFSRLPRSTTPAPLRDIDLGQILRRGRRSGRRWGNRRVFHRSSLRSRQPMEGSCKAASRPGSAGSSTATQLPLRLFALCALVWGVGYLTWRIGWSGEGANPRALRDAARDRGLRPLGARRPSPGTRGRARRRCGRRPRRGARSTSTSAPTTSRSRWWRRRWPAAAPSPTRTPPTCSTTGGGRRWRSWRSSPAPAT